MRLLLIGLNFAPELTGCGKFSGEMAAWLAARGHQVSVVTTPPYYPAWEVAPEWRGRWWHHEDWNGVSVTRCPLYVPRRVTGGSRVLHLVSYALSSLPATIAAALHEKPDIVAAVAPTLLAAPTALAVARLTGARAWLHVQDFEIDAAFELGLLDRHILTRGLLGIERAVLGGFDLVTTISERMRDRLIEKSVAAERVALFPNWVDTDQIRPLDDVSRLRASLGIPSDQLVALYSGSMGAKQGLEYVLDAARRLTQRMPVPPLFLLAGQGSARAELERMAAGSSNIRFLPLRPEADFNEFLNLGDIQLLPQRRDASELVMPSKLGAMLAAGKPVVATVPEGSMIANMIRDAGIVVPPEDGEALADAIQALASDGARRGAMGRRARQLAEARLEAGGILSRLEGRLLDEIKTAR